MQKDLFGHGGGGGGYFSKIFCIFYMLNSKNRFQPKFWIGTCPMRKTILPIIRDIEPTAFFMKKKIIFFETFLWSFLWAILH